MSLRNATVGVDLSVETVSQQWGPASSPDGCLFFVFRAFLKRRTPQGISLGCIYVFAFGCLVRQYYICVCINAHLKVGPTPFPIRERFLDSCFQPPYGSNVRWSNLIALVDKLISASPGQSCPTSRLRDRHMVCTSSAISVMAWRGKCLGCGATYQQLPRSPTSEILRICWKLLQKVPRNTTGGGTGGGVLPSLRVWRGRQGVSTRDWNLMPYSNSPLTGGQNTHTEKILMYEMFLFQSNSMPIGNQRYIEKHVSVGD